MNVCFQFIYILKFYRKKKTYMCSDAFFPSFFCIRLIFVNYQFRYFFHFNILVKKGSPQGSKNHVFVNCNWQLFMVRSSHRRCSLRKNVFRNFVKFTGKRLCQSLFLNKVADLSLQLYLKRDSGAGVFLRIFRNLSEQLFYRTPLGDSLCMAPALPSLLCVLLTDSS